METAGTPRACTLDAMGTMLKLLPPWERLDPALTTGVAPADVEAAFRREMTFYAEHATEARDVGSLLALRERCAEILSEGLRRTVEVGSLMAAIEFEPFPETAATLSGLRARSIRLACVSNWDFELPHVLERLGIAEHLDVVVTSAQAGVAKPDPAIFEIALAKLGCAPAEAIHVGDSDADVDGARAAGMEVLRIARDGEDPPRGVTAIASLDEISEHLRG